MATFFGGPQLSQIYSVNTTVSIPEGGKVTLYTIPAGYYGFLKFAWIRSSTPQFGNVEAAAIYANLYYKSASQLDAGAYTGSSPSSDVTLTLNSGILASASYDSHVLWYNSPDYIISDPQNLDSISTKKANMFLNSGDRIKAGSYNDGEGTNFVYELVIELYKKP